MATDNLKLSNIKAHKHIKHPELLARLNEMGFNNEFLSSIKFQILKGYQLTPKQIAAAEKAISSYNPVKIEENKKKIRFLLKIKLWYKHRDILYSLDEWLDNRNLTVKQQALLDKIWHRYRDQLLVEGILGNE